MKFNHIIILFMAIMAPISAYAQKQLTIVNEDTGESFEVTVPDGLKIYQYNQNWLDSIPYLMEHIRNKESWAYENLARCYRYGIGVEKCITNAMLYYDESDLRATDVAEAAYTKDPTDELGFMNHLVENIGKKKMTIDEALTLIEEYPNPKPDWMVRMKSIFDNRNVDDLEAYVKSMIDWDTFTGDEIFASVVCLMILRPETPSFTSRISNPESMQHLILVAQRLPILYKIGGDKYLDLYQDCPTDEQALKNAFKLYHKAYLYGFLSMKGGVAILDYRDNNALYEGFPFSHEELTHLDGFYSKELREYYNSPCVIEEVVEIDEAPVELIKEE